MVQKPAILCRSIADYTLGYVVQYLTCNRVSDAICCSCSASKQAAVPRQFMVLLVSRHRAVRLVTAAM